MYSLNRTEFLLIETNNKIKCSSCDSLERLVFGALVICFAILISACSAPTPYKGFLWKITQKDAPNEIGAIYLWGVSHTVWVESEIVFSNEVNVAFEKSNLYLMESDLDLASAYFKNIEALPAEMKSKNWLRYETQIKLESYLSHISDDEAIKTKIRQLHPFYLFAWLGSDAPSIYPSKNTRVTQKKAKPDLIFLDKAKKTKKSINYLEPFEAPIISWNNNCASKEEGSNLVDQYLNILMNDEKLKPSISVLQIDKNRNDFSVFDADYAKSRAEFLPAETFFRCIVVPRNSDWVEKIIAYSANKQTAFITFGAGHLVSKDGVIAMLKSKGLNAELVIQK